MATIAQVTVQATNAHLWLEEIVVGDSTEDIGVVWQLLELSDSCATVLLEGGECAALWHVAPVEDAALRRELAAAKTTLGTFSEILRERYAAGVSAGPGSRLDELTDSVFTVLQARVETVAVGLRRTIASELRAFRFAELTLVVSIILVTGFGFFLLWRLEHRRKLATTSLHAAYAKDRALLTAMPDMMFRIGADGTIREFVPAVRMEPHVPPGDFLGKKAAEVMPAELAKRITQDVARTIETGEVRNHEYTLPSGGEERDYEYRLIRCANKEALAVVRDITERKQAETALNNYALAQNALLKVSQSVSSTLDLLTVLQTVSDGAAQVLDVETTAVYLLEGEELILGATTPPLDPQMPGTLRRAQLSDHPHILEAVSTELPVVLPDTRLAKLSPAENDVVEQRRLRSLVFMPIKHEENVVGVLILGTVSQPREFSDREIDLCRTLTNELALGIQNARLHADLKRYSNELEIRTTERKRAEEELRYTEEMWRSITEDAPDYIMTLDNDLNIIFTNRAAPGLTVAELLGKPLVSFALPEHQEMVIGALERARDRREMVVYETVYSLPDGGCIYFESRVVPRVVGGQLIGLTIQARDITERKRAGAEIQEWKSRYEVAVEASGHVLYDWNADTNEVTYGGELEGVFGYTIEDMAGGLSRWEELIHPDDLEYFKGSIEQLVEARSEAHLEYRVLAKNGEYKHVEDRGRFVLDATGRKVRMIGLLEDITERKHAQERLWFLSSFVEQASDGMAVADMSGDLLFVNEAWANMHGYQSGDELGGRNLAVFHTEEQLEKEVEPFNESVLKEGSHRGEVGHLRSDGSTFPTQMTTTLLKGPDGEPFAFVGVATDITERKRAEEFLRKSEAQLRAMFDQAAVGITHITLDGNFQSTNRRFAEMLGYSENELQSMSFVDVTHPDDREMTREYYELIRKTRIGRYLLRKRYVTKTGVTVWADLSVALVTGARGKPAFFIGAASDVTEQHLAEEAVKQREAEISSIFRAAPVGIGLVRDRVIIEVNDVFCAMVGYTAKELIGENARIVYANDEDYERVGRDKYGQIAASGMGTVETRFRRKDGVVIDILLSSAPVDPTNHHAEMTFTALDITDRKRTEAALTESEQRLRGLAARLEEVREEERTGIARDLHDELGQKVTGLRLDLESLALQIPDSRTDLLASVASLANLAEECIDTTQSLSADLRPPMLDLLGLGSAAEWYTKAYAARSGLDCELDLPDSELNMPQKPATALFRILQEALTNVVRHAKATQIRVSLREEEGVAVLEVTDNGIGLPKPEAATVAPLGILGMSERAAAYGGELKVERVSPCGTMVEARIPVAEPETAPGTATGGDAQ